MLKRKILAASALSVSVAIGASVDLMPNRDSLWEAKHGNAPAHWLTSSEAAKLDEYHASIKNDSIRATPTDPRTCGEFEPVEAVLIAYPGKWGFSLNLVQELTKTVKVIVLAPSSNHSSLRSQLQNFGGIEMDSVEFETVDSDTYWTRDYGPWCIAEGEDKISIVDFTYNRPRPNDNGVPGIIGQRLNMDVYKLGLTQCGGNWMANGYGEAVSTDLVTDENSSMSKEQIQAETKTYLGVDTYHITKDPLGDYIKHVDCWGKYLAPDKILIGDVSGNKKAAYDEVADYFANHISPYGTPYKVYRVYTSGEPYTNSTIVNNKVFVPIQGTNNDAAALEVYREAMPGYEVIGILNTSNNKWMSTDALHCRTKGVTERDLLYIEHIPLHDTVTSEAGKITLDFDITDYGKESIDLDNSQVVYTIGDSEALNYADISVNGSEYEATIKAGLTNYEKITYYIVAKNSSSKTSQFPIMGAQDPVEFTMYTDDVSVIMENKSKIGGMSFTNGANALQFSMNETGVLEVYGVNGALIKKENVQAFQNVSLEKSTLGTQMLLYKFTPVSNRATVTGRVMLAQ